MSMITWYQSQGILQGQFENTYAVWSYGAIQWLIPDHQLLLSKLGKPKHHPDET